MELKPLDQSNCDLVLGQSHNGGAKCSLLLELELSLGEGLRG